MQINNKGLRLPTPIERIAYTGMSLTGKPLEWFQFYLTETQVNRITSTNNKIKYMFSTQKGFCNQFTQIYKDAKEEKTATQKLYKLKQTSSAMVYTTEFQSLSV